MFYNTKHCAASVTAEPLVVASVTAEPLVVASVTAEPLVKLTIINCRFTSSSSYLNSEKKL